MTDEEIQDYNKMVEKISSLENRILDSEQFKGSCETVFYKIRMLLGKEF